MFYMFLFSILALVSVGCVWIIKKIQPESLGLYSAYVIALNALVLLLIVFKVRS